MSVKRKSYSADFKAKLVLEVLEGKKTINEIASKYEVLPLSLRNWKKLCSTIMKHLTSYIQQVSTMFKKAYGCHFLIIHAQLS